MLNHHLCMTTCCAGQHIISGLDSKAGMWMKDCGNGVGVGLWSRISSFDSMAIFNS